jgi:hypothetical protein
MELARSKSRRVTQIGAARKRGNTTMKPDHALEILMETAHHT